MHTLLLPHLSLFSSYARDEKVQCQASKDLHIFLMRIVWSVYIPEMNSTLREIVRNMCSSLCNKRY